ncbi:hypothetical protein H4R34_001042 [Dimargaris verticillata]|uniref:Uncharacterized protein n=1 Tax=Dimargaris verticillata TaxID=2761393 RepID=A0A9W8BAL4_9FUNG|nr:hypothetical protein H4R34_001042 [Dimargaris verticillata]
MAPSDPPPETDIASAMTTLMPTECAALSTRLTKCIGAVTAAHSYTQHLTTTVQHVASLTQAHNEQQLAKLQAELQALHLRYRAQQLELDALAYRLDRNDKSAELTRKQHVLSHLERQAWLFESDVELLAEQSELAITAAAVANGKPRWWNRVFAVPAGFIVLISLVLLYPNYWALWLLIL